MCTSSLDDDYMILPPRQQFLTLRVEGAGATVRSETSPSGPLDDGVNRHPDLDISVGKQWFEQVLVDPEGLFLLIQVARPPGRVTLRQQHQASMPLQFSSLLQ